MLVEPDASGYRSRMLPFFDAHVTVGPRKVVFKEQVGGTEATFRRLEECGIRESLVHHTRSVEDAPQTGNRLLAGEIRGRPGTHPVWALMPFSTGELGTPVEVRAALKAEGIRAVILAPAAHQWNNAEWCAGDLYAMLEAMRMPVFVRYRPPDYTWDELHSLLVNHPRLPVILRNVHYTVDRTLFRLLDLCPNLHMETSKYVVFFGIEDVVRRFGAERLIFGSETPFLSPGSPVTALALSPLPQGDKEKIARGNLVRLLEGIDYDA